MIRMAAFPVGKYDYSGALFSNHTRDFQPVFPGVIQRFIRFTEAGVLRVQRLRHLPHLTVAQSEFDEAVSTLEPWLPFSTRAERAMLLEQVQAMHWREVATFDLEDA